MHQLHGAAGDQRRRLGGLGDHRIAGGQGRGDLAGEDGEGEVPRADADEYAASLKQESVLLAGRPWQHARGGELAARLGGVVAKEIDRLAPLGDGIGDGLAGFAHAQGEQLAAMLDERIGDALEDGGALLRRRTVPLGLGALGDLEGAIGGSFVGEVHAPDHPACVAGVGRLDLARAHGLTVDQRGRFALTAVHCRIHLRSETLDLHRVVQVDAGRVTPVAEHVLRQGDARVRDAARGLDHVHGLGDDLVHRCLLVDDAVDEGRVGAVLEQPPDEVRQQVSVTAHGRVHAAGHVQLILADHLLVQLLAHTVQALELVAIRRRIPSRAGDAVHAGQRVRVVGGELRVQVRTVEQQAAGAGQVAHVRRRLAREHGIACESAFLGALDLRVPVGALHQAHGNHPPLRAGQLLQPAGGGVGALLIGLQSQAESVPAVQRRFAEHALEHLQLQLQALGLLRIDAQADAPCLGLLGQGLHARREFRQYALALRQLQARMQGRQLDRYARCGDLTLARFLRPADGLDGAGVRIEVARGVLGRERGFTQHVVGIAIGGVLAVACPLQRITDRATHHELVAHDAHGLTHGLAHHRLTNATGHPLHQQPGLAHHLLRVRAEQTPREHQAPGGHIDEGGALTAQVLLPVAGGDLLGDQLVRRRGVGNAQQGLGDAHEQDALLRGEVVLLQERVDAAVAATRAAHSVHQARGDLADLPAQGLVRARQGDQRANRFRLVGQVLTAQGPMGARPGPRVGAQRKRVACRRRQGFTGCHGSPPCTSGRAHNHA